MPVRLRRCEPCHRPGVRALRRLRAPRRSRDRDHRRPRTERRARRATRPLCLALCRATALTTRTDGTFDPMRIGLLGALEVHDDNGRAVATSGAKLRALLAVLALHAGR